MAIDPNTPPLANADTASATTTAPVSGNVLGNDSDPNGLALSVATVNGQAAGVGTAIAGLYGSLVLRADGTYDYVPYANPAIAPGTTASDVFQYTVADGYNYTTSVSVVTAENLITQSEAFNSTSWLKFTDTGTLPTVTANADPGPNGGARTAEKVVFRGADSGLYYKTNVAGQYTFSVWVKLVSGSGNLTVQYYESSTDRVVQQTVVANGTWQRVSVTFTGDGNANSNVAIGHNSSQSATGTFEFWGAQLNPGASPQTYVPTTGAPGSITTTTTTPVTVGSTLTVAVTAPPASTNDQPPVAIGDTATVSVTGTTTGNVLANDRDPAGLALNVVAINGHVADVGTSVAGLYGSLLLRADGTYDYVPYANAAIAPGETVTDIFQYTIGDGQSYTATVPTIAAQNLLLHSETFDDRTWGSFTDTGTLPMLTANVDTGPNGGAATADKVVFTGSDSGIYCQTNITGKYTFSVWVKLVSGGGNLTVLYYKGSDDSVVAQTVVANGTWQRVSVSFTGDGAANSNIAIGHNSDQSATGTFELWGAQLNPGSIAQTYVPTAGHRDILFANTPVAAAPSANLVVSVTGADPATPGALNFAGGQHGVVVNLATGSWSRATTIMPLGDSITYGWSSIDYEQGQTNRANGYRGPLWWDFANQSSLINFVGPNNSGDSLLPSQRHAGYPGWRSDELAAQLPSLLKTYHPDAVLVLAGTNDIFQQNAPAEHVATVIKQMITDAGALSPQTHIYVATLTPINQDRVLDTPLPGQPNDAQMVAIINDAIRATVAAMKTAGYNVSLIDTSAMTLADIADAAHPTTAGYAKLGQIFYNAILAEQPLAGGTPGGTAHAIASDVTSVTGSEANDLLIGGSASASLSGGGGNDRLVAGSGTTALSGGSGADQFVFTWTSGATTISDFKTSEGDLIELDGFAGLSQFSQLSGQIQQIGGNTVINLSSFGASTITLTNFTGALSAQNFLFHS